MEWGSNHELRASEDVDLSTPLRPTWRQMGIRWFLNFAEGGVIFSIKDNRKGKVAVAIACINPAIFHANQKRVTLGRPSVGWHWLGRVSSKNVSIITHKVLERQSYRKSKLQFLAKKTDFEIFGIDYRCDYIMHELTWVSKVFNTKEKSSP